MGRAPRMGVTLGLVLLVLSLLAAPLPVLAQSGGTITYGSSVLGSFTAETPFVIYRFNANAGDQISLYLVGLAADVQPTASLLGPDQRQLAVSEADPLGESGGQVARLDYRAVQTGALSLLVANETTTAGDYMLTLRGQPAAASTVLESDTPLEVTLEPEDAPASLRFAAPASGTANLTISTTTANFAFLARVYDPTGALIAGLSGDALRAASLTVGPGSGAYEVRVAALETSPQGTLELALVGGGAAPPVVAVPTSTPAPAIPVATVTPSVCRATSGLNVNVRTGPGTNYDAFGSLFAGSELTVVGRSSDTTWYVVDYNGRQGWVANSVVSVSGPCSTLPFVAAPPTPTAPPPTPTPTVTPGPSISFTINGTNSVNIAAGDCVTVAWNTSNISEVYYEGTGVPGVGSRTECPATTTTYTLRVVLRDGSEVIRTVQANTGSIMMGLNPSGVPNYGTTNLTAGFAPSPYTVTVTSGGPVNADYLGGVCGGYMTVAPDYRIQWSGSTAQLRFAVQSAGDTTLVVSDPGGTYYCDDDSAGGLNPLVQIGSPATGTYNVWVGSFGSGDFHSSTLSVTE